MGDGWRDPGQVAEYLSREIPHREIAEGLLLDALPARLGQVLDLGTGDGRTIALIRERYPQAAAIGTDFSEPMLERAAERFSGDALVQLQKHDLTRPLGQMPRCDAVVSALAIHHLEHERKRTLFGEIHSLLAAGGIFANLDLVASASVSEHERFRRAIGRPQDDPADRLAGLCEQIQWLGQAGFAEVECAFKWRELTLILARR